METRSCNWCDEEAEYVFVGKTHDDQYKIVTLCEEHNLGLRKACAEKNIPREEGMANKLFGIGD